MVVVIVIAILAAISIVAYTNVQNRAHDSVVQQDLRQIATKLNEWIVMDGQMPHVHDDGGINYAGIESLPDKWGEIRITHSSYDTSANNLYICRHRDGQGFEMAAWSRSGNGFAYRDGNVQQYDRPPESIAATCSALGSTPRNGSSWVYDHVVHGWRL